MRRHGRPSSGRRAEPEPRGGERPAAAAGEQDLGRALRDAATALTLTLPTAFPVQVATYLEELDRWQRIGRLTAYADPGQRLRHLVVESLMLLAAVPEATSPLLDIGSGPGIPGLILKMARPDWEVALVEASRRRANFLRHVVRQLRLDEVRVLGERAESLARGALANHFETVTMRAVAGPEEAGVLARRFLAPTGRLVMPLGSAARIQTGAVREVTLPVPGELPWRRQFLIILRAELEAHVPRGTGRVDRARHRGGEPEGRRREDDDRPESG